MTDRDRTTRALKAARRLLGEERRLWVESHSKLKVNARGAFRVVPNTLEPRALPMLRHFDKVLGWIDDALGEVRQ